VSIIFFGPVSKLNKVIVESMVEQHADGIVWLVSDSGVEKMPALANVSFIGVDPEIGIEETIKKQKDSFGPLNGVVFADGVGGVRPAKSNSSAFVEEMFQKNIFSFFELTRALIRSRLLEKGASIVCLSSVSSVKGLKSKSVYSASKAALDAAVRGLAAELSSKRIRVNSIQKGWVDVDMELDFIKDNIEISEDSDFARQLLGAVPATELASLIMFLLSDKVTTMTGVNLKLDGGYTL
jgi:NAD(P)-dependent dehydrogenase (short-subunit alcohol dehydrogenase family)